MASGVRAEGDTGSQPVGARPQADHPLESDADDRLGFGLYADSLANLIDDPETRTPLTIAISAPWGAGKTSLGRLVARRLQDWPRERGDRPHVVAWFNAWVHDDAPHLGAALAAEVARTANRHRAWWQRLIAPLPTSMLLPRERRGRRWLTAGLALAAAMVVVASAVYLDVDLLGPFGIDLTGRAGAEGDGRPVARAATAIALLVAVGSPLWSRLFRVATNVESFITDPQAEAAQGSMREVRGQLGDLVRQATRSGGRMVVFVDDLERCSSGRALEICETANQLLSHRDLVTVLIVDLPVLARAAQDRHGSEGDHGVGGRFLQKIVQVEFDLPVAGRSALKHMFTTPSVDESDHHARGEQEVSSEQRRRPTSRRLPSAVTLGRPRRSPSRTDAEATHARPEERDAVRRRGWTTFAVLVVLAGVGGSLEEGSRAYQFVIVAFGILFYATIGLFIAAWWRRRARKRKTDQIDEEIRKRLRNRLESMEHAEGVAVEEPALAHDIAKDVEGATDPWVEQRMRRILVDARLRQFEVESPVMAYLPPDPRSAKRVLYHLHVWLGLAVGRRLVGDVGAPVTPVAIEKWVVMRQRWPELCWAIRDDPTCMGALEAPERGDLEVVLGQLGDPVSASEELDRFLRNPPMLGDVVTWLISGRDAASTGTGARAG